MGFGEYMSKAEETYALPVALLQLAGFEHAFVQHTGGGCLAIEVWITDPGKDLRPVERDPRAMHVLLGDAENGPLDVADTPAEGRWAYSLYARNGDWIGEDEQLESVGTFAEMIEQLTELRRVAALVLAVTPRPLPCDHVTSGEMKHVSESGEDLGMHPYSYICGDAAILGTHRCPRHGE